VVGFLWAFDDSSAGHFHYTTKTDSIFDLTVNDSTDITGGSTIIGSTRFHTFYIRAVDNRGKPDPNIIIFNRTTFKASTIRPHVRFIGSIPSGLLGVDTLSDGQPFKICWTGDDSDGVVTRYKFDVGSYSSPLTSDTCAYFNDTVPGSVGLASGVYNLTLTAVDNALAVGKTNLLFVVNHDPETWFEPKNGLNGPVGYYNPPFLNGSPVDPSQVFTFVEGHTVPYRSTVWFNWDGEDLGRPGTPNNPNPESNCINGYSLELRGGTRNGANPYVIGFIDQIPGTPPRPFKSSEPNYLRQAGFPQFVLDSLDEGRNIFMLVASRDCSNRADGTKASFRFNCNFPPFMDSLSVEDGYQGEPGKIITWFTHDREDGSVRKVKIKLDGVNIFIREGDLNQTFVPDSTFARLSPTNPHSVEVWAIDRADIQSDNSLIVYFDLVPPGPTRRFTRRP